jgi:hypothetical protein
MIFSKEFDFLTWDQVTLTLLIILCDVQNLSIDHKAPSPYLAHLAPWLS